MGDEGFKQDSNPATFVLNDVAHVRKASRILMLGHAEAARSSAATRPSMRYYNKSSSYGYQPARRHLCLFQSRVKLQGWRWEVLDKNVQFILREIKETQLPTFWANIHTTLPFLLFLTFTFLVS
jgi:hypothetical protein